MAIVQTSILDELYKKSVEVSKSEKRFIKEIVRGLLKTVDLERGDC